MATWDPYWSQARSPSMKASLFPPSLQLFPFFFFHCRGWFMQSDIDWRSVDPFSGWNLKIWYLWPVNVQKKWVAKFSNLTQCRTNQKENWMLFSPHPLAFLIEDFKIHIAVPFLWSVSGNIVFTCMWVCRLPSFDWALSWSQGIPQPAYHLLAGP